MAVNVTPGFDLQPSAQQVPLESNYITDFNFLNQYLPDTYEKEFERYGNRSVSSFLRLVGAEMPSNSDLIKWAEQGRLHVKYQNCTSASAAGAGTRSAVWTIPNNVSNFNPALGGTQNLAALRVGQTVMISDNTPGSNLSNKGIVTVAPTAGAPNVVTIAYYEGTGQEIWEQTDGKIDGFVCSSGTGGTISGVSNALKEKNKDVKIYLADPKGSALYNYIKTGELKSEGGSITEGIGSSRVTKNFENAKIDDAFSIDDHEALPILYDLIQNEGLSLGTSCGINIAGAIRLGKELGPGKTIVTILCDRSDKYSTKMFNKNSLKKKVCPSLIGFKYKSYQTIQKLELHLKL